MIEVSQAAEALLPKLDGLLFDMDGVLLDITKSIRAVNCLAPPFYLREVLGWNVRDDILTSDDIELFKNAGGFNDDTDLTCAIVLHYLVKENENPGTAIDTLSVFQPTIARYAARIAERGGGLSAAEQICTEHLTYNDRTLINESYRRDKIVRVHCELFAGTECSEMYGFEPSVYHGDGFWKLDTPIIDVDRLDRAANVRPEKSLGILTGRLSGEARVGLHVAGIEDLISMDEVITGDEGHLKPNPSGLRRLVDRLNIRAGIYIGDTRDDFRTVENYRDRYPGAPPMLGALVLSGPAGDTNSKIFRRSQADIIASDVNEILRWICGEKSE